jgi:K+-transporting ATPase KdpF subunit
MEQINHLYNFFTPLAPYPLDFLRTPSLLCLYQRRKKYRHQNEVFMNTLLLLIVIALSLYLCVAMVAPEKFQE